MKANIDLKNILVLHQEDHLVIINYESGLSIPMEFSYIEGAKSFYEKVNAALVSYRNSLHNETLRYIQI